MASSGGYLRFKGLGDLGFRIWGAGPGCPCFGSHRTTVASTAPFTTKHKYC